MANAPLTDNAQNVLKYFKDYFAEHGFAPTYSEMQLALGYKTKSALQKPISQLVAKGYITSSGAFRGLRLIEESPEAARLELVGTIAAGLPIEAIETTEFIDVPKSMLKNRGVFFALRVKGDSMQDAHIIDGDIVIIKKQKVAENGDTVAAIVDSSATLKKYFRKNTGIELHSANEKYKPIKIKEASDFEILGVLIGVIRKT